MADLPPNHKIATIPRLILAKNIGKTVPTILEVLVFNFAKFELLPLNFSFSLFS